MSDWKLIQGKRYRIKVSLNWVESFSPDGLVKTKFEENGFTDVTISDEDGGQTRIVEGTWNHPDTVLPHDSHLRDLEME